MTKRSENHSPTNTANTSIGTLTATCSTLYATATVQGGGEAGYLRCSCPPCKVWRPPRSVRCGLCLSAFVVDGGGVAVGVSECERPAEGAIDRLGQDRHAVLGELVVKGLGVLCSQP